jgi:hypothetical protein
LPVLTGVAFPRITGIISRTFQAWTAWTFGPAKDRRCFIPRVRATAQRTCSVLQLIATSDGKLDNWLQLTLCLG